MSRDRSVEGQAVRLGKPRILEMRLYGSAAGADSTINTCQLLALLEPAILHGRHARALFEGGTQ